MGVYINHPVLEKEDWLEIVLAEKKAQTISLDEFLSTKFEDIPEDKCILVHVDNTIFTGLAVAYSKRELEYFQTSERDGSDPRKKCFFLCDKEEALKYAK